MIHHCCKEQTNISTPQAIWSPGMHPAHFPALCSNCDSLSSQWFLAWLARTWDIARTTQQNSEHLLSQQVYDGMYAGGKSPPPKRTGRTKPTTSEQCGESELMQARKATSTRPRTLIFMLMKETRVFMHVCFVASSALLETNQLNEGCRFGPRSNSNVQRSCNKSQQN